MKDNSLDEVMEQIIGNYFSQLEKYRLLLALAKEQLTAAQGKNTTLVDQILDRRQQLIIEIDHLNSVIEAPKAGVIQSLKLKDFNLTELSRVLPVPAGELQKAIVQIGEILIEIAETDNLNQQILSQGLQGVKEQFKKAKTFREVSSAYKDLGAKHEEAKFFDRSE